MDELGWIELRGAANVRDLGGRPTVDGLRTRPGRLIRSDNLQGLTPADVRHLVDDLRVRSIADLRSDVELAREGPGPMLREPLVTVEQLSLFAETGRTTDAAALDEDAPVMLPWQTRGTDLGTEGRRGASGVYLGYLGEREDSILGALRLIAHTDGATIVHCAAGKDRTGVVVALALAEVGVTRASIVADYVATAERIQAIFSRLAASPTYAGDVHSWDYAKHTPRAETMQRLLERLDADFGGARGWLRAHGWSERDAQALRGKLVGPESSSTD